MNRRVKTALFAAIACLCISLPLLAHHGNAAYEAKKLTLKGTVSAWLWTNPHVFVKVDVKDDSGKVTHWSGELVAPSNMVNFGFTPQTLKPGDEITIVTSQVARSGAPIARLDYIVLANGQIMKTHGKYDGDVANERRQASAQ